MDIKIAGLTTELMSEALAQAKRGRAHILDKMLEVLAAPRPEMKDHAPRIEIVKINPGKIGAIIGPGGKTIRWQDGDVRPFELVSLRVKRFRHAWLAPPKFALSSMESPVHSERCTPGSVGGVRKPTRGQPG